MGRPFLHRGQPPAKGVLHTPQRDPVRIVVCADGKATQCSDPRGYWLGQHNASGARIARRHLVARLGRRQAIKYIKEQRRG